MRGTRCRQRHIHVCHEPVPAQPALRRHRDSAHESVHRGPGGSDVRRDDRRFHTVHRRSDLPDEDPSTSHSSQLCGFSPWEVKPTRTPRSEFESSLSSGPAARTPVRFPEPHSRSLRSGDRAKCVCSVDLRAPAGLDGQVRRIWRGASAHRKSADRDQEVMVEAHGSRPCRFSFRTPHWRAPWSAR